MRRDVVPYYFQAKAHAPGSWFVELYDKDLTAMGVASHQLKPLLYSTKAEATKAALAKGLSPFPGVA